MGYDNRRENVGIGVQREKIKPRSIRDLETEKELAAMHRFFTCPGIHMRNIILHYIPDRSPLGVCSSTYYHSFRTFSKDLHTQYLFIPHFRPGEKGGWD
jgi:hypothetical protein